LKDFEDLWVTLFFLPSDFGITCPQELIQIALKKPDFDNMFTKVVVPIVIWMNPDPALVKKSWSSDLGINVLNDVGGEIAAKYGV
jgi:alkyl hydroperoxide reductase subunit AhpC